MGSMRFVLRQLRSDHPVVLLLAVLVALGSATAAAAPRWISGTIASAAADTIDEGDSDLTYRQRQAATPDFMDETAERVITNEPVLATVYPTMRWSVATDEGAVGDNQARFLTVRMPGSFHKQVRVTEGAMPSPTVDYVEDDALPYVDLPLADVVVSADVAAELGLEIGAQYRIRPPSPVLPGQRGYPVFIRVTGLFEPVDAEWDGWTEHAAALDPWTERTPIGDLVYHGAVLADPAAMSELVPVAPEEEPVGGAPMLTQIIRPATPVADDALDLPAIAEAVRRVESGSSGWLTALDDEIGTFEAQYVAGQRVTALGAMSIAALWVILLALVTRLLADRRMRAVLLARVRGAPTRTVWWLLTLEGAIVAAPAAGVGTAVGLAVIPEPDLTVSYVVPGAIAAFVIFTLPAYGVASARHRSTQRDHRTSAGRQLRRIVAETGLVVLAAVMLWLAAGRTSEGTSVDPVISLTPVAVAVAVGLMVLRSLPATLGAAHRVARRRQAATAYVATRWAVRNRGAAALPAIAMLIAIELAALGAAIDQGADRSREAASWAGTPADVVITSSSAALDPGMAERDGDTGGAVAYPVPSRVTRDDSTYQSPAVLAVDIGAWRRVVEHAPTTPEPVQALSGGGAPPPALVAGSFGAHTPLSVGDEIAIGGVPVEIVAVQAAFHGITETPTIVVPARAVPGQFDTSGASALFLSGDFTVDEAEELAAAYPDAVVRSRAQAIADIDAAPLLAAALDVHRALLIGAVALATAAAALSLLVAARAREFSLSVLHTLGFSRRQTVGLVAAEVVPSAFLATVAGVVAGSALTVLAGDALDLALLTTTLGFASPLVLDVATTAAVALGILGAVTIGVVLAIVVRPSRLGSALRIGE